MSVVSIHPTAIIEEGASLGQGVIIEAGAYVSGEASIGPGCVIKQGARILGRTSLGEGSRIFSYAIVGDIPQDISYRQGDAGGVIIGPGAVVREFATINSGTSKGDGFTRIGPEAFIMAYCHVAHDCQLGQGVIMANSATLAGHVQLGDFAVVGGLTPIHQFVRVGRCAMVAGASALSQDLPPFCLAEGNRASVRSLNLVGLRRRFEPAEVERLGRAYKFLFRQGSLRENAQALLGRAQEEGELVRELCEFILSTKRGIPVKNEKVKNEKAL